MDVRQQLGKYGSAMYKVPYKCIPTQTGNFVLIIKQDLSDGEKENDFANFIG
ncbi:hypothetical protein O3M35_009111 [Rhynocoris fuscipes]|uniref:Uncharacterized protein n=1 Tax=Rhynocoris fuscipes TaxID=488301 RepID=A0AAW1D9B4_9HEMI